MGFFEVFWLVLQNVSWVILGLLEAHKLLDLPSQIENQTPYDLTPELVLEG